MLAPALTNVRPGAYLPAASPESWTRTHLPVLTRHFRAGPLPGLLLIILLSPVPTMGQTGTVRVERENFRAAPAGSILAEVVVDTRLTLGDARDQWRQATLEGWIWAASVREEAEDGHDLVVSAGNGENLRATPNGDILARIETGTRLEQVERRDSWVRVRRTGWIWQPSLRVEEAVAAPVTPTEETPPAPATGEREFVVASEGVQVLESPGGDATARIEPGASVEIVAREGDWARVRVEGWAFTGSLAGADDSAAILRDVSAADLAADPDRYRGRLVEWPVQFIAIQQAERFRSDFLQGEHFILARGPRDEPGFVYLAVPAGRLSAARALTPLQRFTALARVRSPRSALTDAPVLDLIEIDP